ncbi:unnamed protein product [Microthlaspi erraticum]|uniref:DUF4378 domain-containing protein n=1 Tax=Microthlaspi erraticum TaxID=1685480 RepID=A0A6D2I766_9BRAS|nr:unnamed protein product [Microthlaspi erraticum]
MGGLLHLFDFHNNSFSRKVFSHHKSRDEDLEAPRNSFELQVDNFQSYHNEKDIPQSYGYEEEEWYERSCYPIEESMKKKIIEELSKRTNDKQQNTPSLVAKLMGMESTPLESTKSTAWINLNLHRHSTKSDQSHEKGGKRNRKGKFSSSVNVTEAEEIMNPPMRREHPQEEELQRFRREFEAWQADKRSKDCSRIVIESDCKEKERLFTRTRSFGRDFNLKTERAAPPPPTRIVVLRPGPQRVYEYEDSLTTSSGTTMEGSRGSSIEEFLEEVKERLKGELQGRALKRSSSVRGSGIETPFSERPFPRSESMRSYAASEVQCNAPDSPQEFISRDTRKLLAERLKNVLRKEMTPSSCSSRLRPTVSDAEKQSDGIDEEEEDLRTNRDVTKKETSSPRNLKRSLSAPVSGTSFGKLLLEDRHVLTGAQIMRKHEAVITEREETEAEAETEPAVVDPIRRKERFNLRKKVSSFRSTLRGRIFGKKIRSMIESNSFEDESIKDFVTGSRFNNFYDRNENSTEVPPSPASVCSSTPEEFWRNVDYLSQISTPDVTVSDENGMPQVFRDISSNLSELRRQINELDSDIQVPTPVEEEAAREIETIVDLGNPDKVFVRDLLVASGLYEGTTDRSLSRWDPFAKPINKSVLEETKENIKKRSNENQEDEEDIEESTRSEDNHDILFDLLNEVLTVVLGPLTKSAFKKKFISSCVSEPTTIRGIYLLESTWRIMSEYLYSQPDKPFCSLDGIIGWDLERCPWSGLIGEEVNVLGREVESMIMADLVDEVVKDLAKNLR